MESKRRYNDASAGEQDPDDTPRQPKRQKMLSASAYTTAWICALPFEMTAATIMLDEVHEEMSSPPHDTNTYILGRIKQQNIVIACLPAMQYGTIKATAVVTHLIRTFPNIRLALMVGIGGAAPSHSNDIRLGDVIVGTRVMPYDLSKVIQNGIERTDPPK